MKISQFPGIQFVFFIVVLCLTFQAKAQVGIGILIPDTSAVLHLESTTKGFLPPRMTDIERDAIFQPKDGLVIFNTTDSTLQYYNGTCWLRTFQKNCTDCFFTMNATSIADTIDRVITDSVAFQLNILQNVGTPQNLGFTIVNQLPLGMTYSIDNNPQFSSGTVDVVFYVTTFTPAGTYPIIIQAVCGSTTINYVYSLTILPCYEVDIINNTVNYDLATDLYATYPSLSTSQPVCVISTVGSGVLVSSNTTTDPAYTTGNLATGSVVAIVNDGNIIGKGGDAGAAYDPNSGNTGEGFDGGTAIDLTVNTTILNNFNIYGGGGGGNAMAFSISQAAGPINFGIFLGGGGGGGAGGGLGGKKPGNIIGLSAYTDGQDATSGQFGVHGEGGVLAYPLNYPFSVGIGTVSIDIVPNVRGGDGGPYGFPGTQGIFNVDFGATVSIGPFPFSIGPFAIPVPVTPPVAGDSGYAIKKNGFTTNIPNNNYNTSFLKGKVGN